MAKPRPDQNGNAEVADLLRDLLITALGAAGVKPKAIREIAQCGMNKVSRITKHIPEEPKNGE
jgi:NTP pyrophosphatase (non-canonical NTP hydrolase)